MKGYSIAIMVGFISLVGFTILTLENLPILSIGWFSGVIGSLLFIMFTLDLANRVQYTESDKNKAELGTNIRLTNWKRK